MKYLRLFLTHAEHEQERKALEKLELYTSYCEDNDEVTIFYKKKPKYEVGDYLLSSGEVIKNADYVDLDVIGVCVIPDNFISQEGINSKARFCALTESQGTVWGYTDDAKRPKFNSIGCVGEDPTAAYDSFKWTPSNTLVDHNTNSGNIAMGVSRLSEVPGQENPYDPNTQWLTSGKDHHIASPYLYKDGKYVFNDGVYNGCIDIDGAVSMLSDMDGLANTTAMKDDDKRYAIKYCATFNTNGTSPGDWYLPAIGELGFIPARFDIILNAITKVGGTKLEEQYWYYWSSTLYSTDKACAINFWDGLIFGAEKSSYSTSVYRARPFIRKS